MQKRNYFVSDKELNLRSAIKRAEWLVDPFKGPITSVYRNPRYNDEPLLYQYTAITKTFNQVEGGYREDEFLGGMAFFEEKAKMKALGEALERYCLSVYKREGMIYSAADKLGSKSLDLTTIVAFSPSQLRQKEFQNFQVHKEDKLWWVKGYSLTDKRSILVPAQLVFVPYVFSNEPCIRLPITTGAAAGTSLAKTILRGINEIVERDAFMIFYLNKLVPPRLNLESARNSQLAGIYQKFKRYNLELFIFNITTDIPIASIMAVIVDKTGLGPAISVGLKASQNPLEAIIGAIEEAEHTRPWLRDVLSGIDYNKPSNGDEIDLGERGLLWSPVKMVSKLDYLLKKSAYFDVVSFINNFHTDFDLNKITNYFRDQNLEIVVVDVTQSLVKKKGFYVVKVIIPKLQPLYLTEDYKYFGGTRLYEVPVKLGYQQVAKVEQQFNKTPHPFL